MTLVHQLMTSPVFTCSVKATLDAAVRLMWEHDCGVVPVVDDAGRLVGIVTDRDACMAAYTQGACMSAIAVAVAMSTDVLTCGPDDPLGLAEGLMEANQVRRVPVIDGERRPIGLLSLNDLARHVARPSAAQRGLLVGFTRTLAAVGRPRSEPTAADVGRVDDTRPINIGVRRQDAAPGV